MLRKKIKCSTLAFHLILMVIAGVSFNVQADIDRTVIDVAVLYTPGVYEKWGSNTDALNTRIKSYINIANGVYDDSGVDLKLRVVHLEQVEYDDDIDHRWALSAVTLGWDPEFRYVEQMRKDKGADVVMLMRTGGGCGMAWIGGRSLLGAGFSVPMRYTRRFAYSHFNVNCGEDTFIHELGHTMGLSHSLIQDEMADNIIDKLVRPHLSYGYGHGVSGEFGTIMAYSGYFNAPRFMKFSNPSILCKELLPCGVDRQEENGADAALALNTVREEVAAYYPTQSSKDVFGNE